MTGLTTDGATGRALRATVTTAEANAILGRPQAAGNRFVVKDFRVTPPVSPALGDAYFVLSGATGVWAGVGPRVATWDGTNWLYYPAAVPLGVADNGLMIHTLQTNVAYMWTGGTVDQFPIGGSRKVSDFQGATPSDSLGSALQWSTTQPAGGLRLEAVPYVATNIAMPTTQFNFEAAGSGRTSFQPSQRTASSPAFFAFGPQHNSSTLSEFSFFNLNTNATFPTTTFSIISTAAAAAGDIKISRAYITGAVGQKTKNQINFDGSLRTSEPRGVRNPVLEDLTLFGCEEAAIYGNMLNGLWAKNVNIYAAGGPAWTPSSNAGAIIITAPNSTTLASDGNFMSGQDCLKIDISNAVDARFDYLQISGDVNVAASCQNVMIIGAQYGGAKNINSITSGWLQPRDLAGVFTANNGWFGSGGGRLYQLIRTTTIVGAVAVAFPVSFKAGTVPYVTITSVGAIIAVNQSNQPQPSQCFLQCNTAGVAVHIIAIGEAY
jgi:Protein of unknown function (DUF2793)